MIFLIITKQKEKPTKEVFENIRGTQPSKCEKFTYITFANDQIERSNAKVCIYLLLIKTAK